MENLKALFEIDTIFFELFNYPMSYIELSGTFFGLISVGLATRANIHTWTTGLVNVVLFFIIYYQVQLYSDMFLQVFFFGASIFGLWQWMVKKPINHDKKITLLSTRQRIFFSIAIVTGTLVLGRFISQIHIYFPAIFSQPASYPYADAFTTTLSIVATFFMAYKKTECWILWIVVDVVSTYLYIQKGILFIAVEYLVFLVLATYGLVEWIKAKHHG
jgi:nicotinamide mononucleotide transporter